MNDNTAANRFAPPKAEVSDLLDAPDGKVVPAGRGARLGAALLDMAINLAIYFAVILPLYGSAGLRGMTTSMGPYLGGLAIYLGLAYGLEAWFLFRSSQSPGKRIVGLRVVRPDGSHAGLGRTLGIRALLFGALSMIPVVGTLFALVDSLFIFSPSRRCLHDLAADTLVVTADSSRAAARIA